MGSGLVKEQRRWGGMGDGVRVGMGKLVMGVGGRIEATAFQLVYNQLLLVISPNQQTSELIRKATTFNVQPTGQQYKIVLNCHTCDSVDFERFLAH